MTPKLRPTLPTPAAPTFPTTAPPTLRTIANATLRATALTFACTAAALALPPSPATATVTPVRAASPGAAPPRAVWPLNPRPEIVRGFEPPPKPWLPGHRGLDLAGSPGQPVLSATAGTITYAGPLAGRGIVVVTNGPLRTTYEPVIPTTHVGATVAPGQQLGTLSTAGTHCPPRTCLHWGLRQATTYLDPLSLLTTRPVRLFPPPATLKPPTTNAATGTERPAPTSPTDPRSSAADRSTGPAPAIVVGVSAVLTVGGALLIRRH